MITKDGYRWIVGCETKKAEVRRLIEWSIRQLKDHFIHHSLILSRIFSRFSPRLDSFIKVADTFGLYREAESKETTKIGT